MPLDPTSGQWVEPTYNTPGVGAIGAMRTMNEFTSQNQYQENKALQALQMLHELQNPANTNEDALAALPEAQNAFSKAGISPDSATAAAASNPAVQFRQGMAAMTADGGSPSTEQMVSLAGSTGAGSPSQLISPFVKFQGSQGRIEQRLQQDFTKTFTDTLKTTQDPQQALKLALSTASNGLPPAMIASLTQQAQQMAPGLVEAFKAKIRSDPGAILLDPNESPDRKAQALQIEQMLHPGIVGGKNLFFTKDGQAFTYDPKTAQTALVNLPPGVDPSQVIKPGANPAAADEKRADHSYEFNFKQLSSLGDPIASQLTRMGRLSDTLEQHTPQADALVVPELVLGLVNATRGSGFRLTQSEIDNATAGRSHWEDLKAAVNKWQTDPSKALSITESQRQQIRALMDVVTTKLLMKQHVLSQANQDLLDNSSDVDAHRRIYLQAKRAIDAIDAPAGYGNPPPGLPVRAPAGPDPDADKKLLDKFGISPGQ